MIWEFASAGFELVARKPQTQAAPTNSRRSPEFTSERGRGGDWDSCVAGGGDRAAQPWLCHFASARNPETGTGIFDRAPIASPHRQSNSPRDRRQLHEDARLQLRHQIVGEINMFRPGAEAVLSGREMAGGQLHHTNGSGPAHAFDLGGVGREVMRLDGTVGAGGIAFRPQHVAAQALKSFTVEDFR